ncbi:hypothetical protein [Cellulomonas oligotrophica]|uniref:Uncharacterized protein n=1 Tax=Cellulomonas oligotrophica TaxID=931536 RepID=A0A7Y9FIT3_9CELL|nr:hypothetical protein [Cellulomonas oligotrophica]NYD87777.1 hypothetical protein [Cellulomonas oligotrophica]GIG33019.1 hypothetical protein Col01nite_21780 [Cellulomonas oligotrophica]
MASITPTVNPLVLKNVDLIIDAGDDDLNFKKHIDQCTYTPASSQATWTSLAGETFTDAATATWTLVLNYVQDWETTDSLSRFLFEHEGETVGVTFKPRTGSGPSFTSTATIVPGAIGGTVNAFATTSVTLGSTKPALVPAG